MAKKNFSGGIDSLFQGSQKDVKGEDKMPKENKRSECSRTTLIVNTGSYEKIRAVAYWERKSIKDIIEKGFNLTLIQYSTEELKEMVEHYRKSNT